MMLKIGEFSKLSMLTVKTLRFYEAQRLLSDLDALLRAFPLDDAGSVRYCALIDAFLPLFDDYLLSAGLLSL